MRRDSVPRCNFVQNKNGISCSPCLKRTDPLKIFALKKQRCPTRSVEKLARQHRRAMNMCTNALVRCANFIESDWDRLTRRCGLHLGFGNAPGARRFRPGELEFGAG